MVRKRLISSGRNSTVGRSLRPVWSLLFFTLFLPVSFCVAQDVHADLPSNGSLRIENRRGDVTVEVWNELFISVSASFTGDAPKKSPVIIRRTDQLLNVMVASDATRAAHVEVDLRLRVPARARVEILTNDGSVNVQGLPSMLDVQTRAGDIAMVFSKPLDELDISARAPVGKITATTMESQIVSDVPRYETGNGKGTSQVRVTSQSGRVSIRGGVDLSKDETTPGKGRKPPTLLGTTADNKGAGAPDMSPGGEPQEIDEGDVVRVDTELVSLNVSVIDRTTNRGLKGLGQSDFKLFEDDAEQQITHFESSNAPFNLVLVIDLSGSTKDKLVLIRDAAQHFVDAARPEDSIAVITFAGTSILVSRLTNDRDLVRQRIKTIETAPGDTKLYDSLMFSMTDALKDASRTRRNALVVMSDGLDGTLPSVKGDGSAVSYSKVLNEIREFDGVVYSVWVDTEYESLSDKDTQPEDFDTGHDRMAEIADAGGGLFYEVNKLEDLAGAYERVVADIGTVYSLAYRPLKDVRDGKWRAIRVKVSRPDAVARGKSGYFAK